MKLKDAITEFIAWKSFTVKTHAARGYAYDLKSLCLYLNNPDIETIGWGDIQKLSNDMIELGWDSNSLVRKFISYRKFFEYWHKKDPRVMDHTWIPVKHMEYRTPRVMTQESYLMLLKTLNDKELVDLRNKVILNLLWDTGARVGEIVSLDVSGLKKCEALIKTEKSQGKRPLRQIFWTEETESHIQEYLAGLKKLVTDKGYYNKKPLLLGLTGRSAGKRLRATGVSQMIGQLCTRAKIERLNAHSFRHHMGHDIIKKGGSNSDVSNILGHSSLASSYIYTMMNNEELKQRYKQFKGD